MFSGRPFDGPLTPISFAVPISLFSRVISTKLRTNIQKVSGHCYKGLQGQRSRSYKCVNAITVEVHISTANRHIYLESFSGICVPPTVSYLQYLATVSTLTVWNSLPDFIRDPTISAECSRRLLKTYLFARY